MFTPTIYANRRRFIQTIGATAILPSTIFMQPESSFAQSDSRYGIQGNPAPEISLDYWIDKDGNPSEYSIQAQKGKWVYFYCFQDWCPGCHSHGFPSLNQLATRFPDHPELSIAAAQTVFEGFSSNMLEDVRKLQLKYDLPIFMGHDPGDPDGDHRPQIMKNYRTGGTPWIIVIAPDGNVVFNDYHINMDNFIDYLEKQFS